MCLNGSPGQAYRNRFTLNVYVLLRLNAGTDVWRAECVAGTCVGVESFLADASLALHDWVRAPVWDSARVTAQPVTESALDGLGARVFLANLCDCEPAYLMMCGCPSARGGACVHGRACNVNPYRGDW
jgi:hypothetical protein